MTAGSTQVTTIEHVPAAEEGTAFPPFDFTTFEPQVTWLVITFVLFYIVLARAVLPRLQRVISERAERIAADIDDAERLHRESEKLKELVDARLAEARSRAQAVLQRARQEIREKQERTLAALDERLKARIAEAEAAIAESRAEVLAELPKIAAEAAQEIHARLLGEPAPAAALKKAVGRLAARSGERH